MADLRKKHGFRYSRIYGIWKGIKTRCGNPNRRDYQSYGGRGIKICKDLERFQPFYDWALSNGYADDLSIDRIDNDKGYSPDNCRWATAKEQSINRRNVALLLFNGKTQCVTDWAKELGLEYKTVFARIKRGWSLEQSLGLLKKKEAII
ncbi:MAG: hypothetical protein LBG05_10870 [Treponema sp.]|nr:hypothetical protein [Treponema sp.]